MASGSDLVFVRRYAKKRWVLPRLGQLYQLALCYFLGHIWGQWRMETEDWFEYRVEPEPWTWRACRAGCGALEYVRESANSD